MAIPQRALRDNNYVPTLLGAASDGSQVPIELAVDPVTNRLLVTATLSGNPLSLSPITGQVKVVTTGTAVVLGSSQVLINGVIVSAKGINTQSITLGTATVTNTVDGTGNGYILAPGASISFAVSNINQIWINGTANDLVSYAGS